MPEWAGEKKKGGEMLIFFLLEDVKLEDFNPAGQEEPLRDPSECGKGWGEGAPCLGVFFLLILGDFNGNLTGF